MSFNTLPNELYSEIFDYLDQISIVRLSICNKQFHSQLFFITKMFFNKGKNGFATIWPCFAIPVDESNSRFLDYINWFKTLDKSGLRFQKLTLSASAFSLLHNHLPNTFKIEIQQTSKKQEFEFPNTPDNLLDKISDIVLPYHRGSDKLLRYIDRMKGLKHLKIYSSRTRETMDDWRFLIDVLPSTNIENLFINCSGDFSDCVALFSKKLHLTNLKILNLAYCHMNDSNAISIANALPQSQLEDLDMSLNGLTDFAAIAFANNLPNCKLKILNLSNCRYFSIAGAVKLAESLPKSKLEDLKLGDNQFSDSEFMPIYSANLVGSNIKKFIAPNVQEDGMLTYLIDNIARTNLQDLDINISHTHLESFITSSRTSKLQNVTLRFVNTLDVLSPQLAQVNFKSLQLYFTQSNSDLKVGDFLHSLRDNFTIESLTLGTIDYKRQYIKDFFANLPYTNFKTFKLVIINDMELGDIAPAIKTSNIRYLDLSMNSKLTPADILNFVDAIKDGNLLEVDFSYILRDRKVFNQLRKDVNKVLQGNPKLIVKI
ncbi:hypothetical protein HDV06_005671 [Boothiomyces sp. JEL0866]|nr:hypothetical protein HDV06_005671 [Boothiomyces sp. JEL0866]